MKTNNRYAERSKNEHYMFGCFSDIKGHKLYGINMVDAHNFGHARLFTYLDGVLNSELADPYVISTTEFPGIKYSAYSWKDYSGDSRPGSNSILFVNTPCFLTIKEIICKYFPQVAQRYKAKGIELFERLEGEYRRISFDTLFPNS